MGDELVALAIVSLATLMVMVVLAFASLHTPPLD
jgi:hypothetical protein